MEQFGNRCKEEPQNMQQNEEEIEASLRLRTRYKASRSQLMLALFDDDNRIRYET